MTTTARYEHLLRLTGEHGLFEHAEFGVPRIEHGHCVDDVARGVVVLCRDHDLEADLEVVLAEWIAFLLSAVTANGTCHNRMNATGEWIDEPGLGDWWGRAIWGLGAAAVHAPSPAGRTAALRGFEVAIQQRSPHPRAMAFAALGAGEIARSDVTDGTAARRLLADAVVAIGPNRTDPDWPWPEARLTYGNGSVVEALLVAGSALADRDLIARALNLLTFLLARETANGRLSLTPVAGRGPNDAGPGFDQQPIEAAALADACARAFTVTGDVRWVEGVRLAAAWFSGYNDIDTTMMDPATGAGYDGLHHDRRNLNQGAESTLAMLSTFQHARALGVDA